MKHRHEEFDQSYHPHRDHRNDISSPVAVVILLLAAIAIMVLLPGLNSWPGQGDKQHPEAHLLTGDWTDSTNEMNTAYEP